MYCKLQIFVVLLLIGVCLCQKGGRKGHYYIEQIEEGSEAIERFPTTTSTTPAPPDVDRGNFRVKLWGFTGYKDKDGSGVIIKSNREPPRDEDFRRRK